jgi:hypothetical protein
MGCLQPIAGRATPWLAVIARNAVTTQSSPRRRFSFNDPVRGSEDWIASLRSQ